jgi:hypothetical protein
LPELSNEGWERDDSVRRTVVLPAELAGRLAAEAERRGISVSDLLIEYAEQGLRHVREPGQGGGLSAPARLRLCCSAPSSPNDLQLRGLRLW